MNGNETCYNVTNKQVAPFKFGIDAKSQNPDTFNIFSIFFSLELLSISVLLLKYPEKLFIDSKAKSRILAHYYFCR